MIKSPNFQAGGDKRAFLHIAWINLLSLDVVTGSLLSGVFAAHVMKVSPGWAYWVVLGSSVWIIYTLDHLVDAMRLKADAHTTRHLFAFKNSYILVGAVGVLAVLDVFLVLRFLEKKVLIFGLAMGVLALVYFLVLHHGKSRQSILVQKEIIVALVYTAGIWGVPVLYAEPLLTNSLALLIVGFFALALMNTLLLAIRDYATDRLDNHPSFALRTGRISTQRTIYFLGGLVMVISLIHGVCLPGKNLLVPIVYTLMAACMIGLIMFPIAMGDDLLNRLLTELVFWLPGLALLF